MLRGITIITRANGLMVLVVLFLGMRVNTIFFFYIFRSMLCTSRIYCPGNYHTFLGALTLIYYLDACVNVFCILFGKRRYCVMLGLCHKTNKKNFYQKHSFWRSFNQLQRILLRNPHLFDIRLLFVKINRIQIMSSIYTIDLL